MAEEGRFALHTRKGTIRFPSGDRNSSASLFQIARLTEYLFIHASITLLAEVRYSSLLGGIRTHSACLSDNKELFAVSIPKTFMDLPLNKL